jgi:HemY protein
MWVLLIFGLAVGFTLAGKFDPGYAVLVYPPYRIELSLTLLVVLFLGLVVLGDLLARLADATLNLPANVRAHRLQQRQQQGELALLNAMTHYLAGHYTEAEVAAKLAVSLSVQTVLAQQIISLSQQQLSVTTRPNPNTSVTTQF